MRNALEFDTLEKSFALQFGEAVELVEHPIPDGDGITYPTAEEKEVKTNSRYYSEIARVIQEKGKTNVPFLPCDMPAGVVGVYAEGEKVGYNAGHSSGYEEGKADGNAEGYAAGREAEYDTFWDAYQQKGNLTNYNYVFAGRGWNDNTFKPKYDLIPTEAYAMFQSSTMSNLIDILTKQGVKLDTSKATSIQNFMTGNSAIKKLPKIDASGVTSATGCAGLFNSCTALEEVEEFVFKESITNYLSLALWCSKLVKFKASGVIRGSISFDRSPLDKESITSVINALSTTATEQTATFKKTAKEAAFTEDEWSALIATKTNWTISLV